MVIQDALHQFEQFGLVPAAVVRGFLGLLRGAPRLDRLQKLELVAGVDEDGAGHLRARDAQHKLAHGLQLAHQGGIITITGHDAEAVNQGIGVGDLHGVQYQQDVRIVFLRHTVAQGGHNSKGVG